MRREIAVVLYATAGIFLFLTLLSYSPFDPTFSFFTNYPVNATPQNAGGYVGAFLAGFLFNLFGWPALLFPVAVIFFALQSYREGAPTPLSQILFVTLTAVIAGGILSLSLSFDNGSTFPAGGILGYLIFQYGQKFLGAIGTSLIFTSALVVFFSLTFSLSLPKRKETPKPAFIPAPKVEPEIPPAEELAKKEEEKPVPAASTPVLTSFVLPDLDLLSAPVPEEKPPFDPERYRKVIEDTIADFGLLVKVVECTQGPTVTMFELELSPGIMPHRIVSLSDNLAMALRATSVRVVAPLPGKSTVGVEVPNPKMSVVYLSEILASPELGQYRSRLMLAFGKDTLGRPVLADLRNMPHLLVAGATGSGKTVCLNSLLTFLLFRDTPDEVQFLLIDPKMVEMTTYNDIPHLLLPVVTEMKNAIESLKWLVGEMERRYRLFSQNNVRSIDVYNSRNVERIPYIVVVIDELADLITVARTEVEGSIIRLSQLARSAGIHLIIATQRPSVNVITGVIKANFPARIAFQVASKVDSRTILDANGAEKLLGRGDMLYLSPAALHPVRAQCCYLSDAEIEKVCQFWKNQGKGPTYDLEFIRESAAEESSAGGSADDPLFEDAVKSVLNHRIASISLLQRRLKIGFNRAARLIEEMEEQGIVGPYREGKPREILR
ncbi:MAG: DNA translocase FtsK [Candidatus Omnitrophota bacterium]